MRSAAVRLFIERARAVNNTLVLTHANLPVIARICIGVDGIPLALELAAARARVLTVEQLAGRLEYDSGVLGRATRAGLPQHQTIRATLDWSHDLLGQPEQVLLRRLAVFAGGWTLRLAEEVCSGAGIERAGVLDLLTLLVDKSVALVDAAETTARYRLLEPIRQYALERWKPRAKPPPTARGMPRRCWSSPRPVPTTRPDPTRFLHWTASKSSTTTCASRCAGR